MLNDMINVKFIENKIRQGFYTLSPREQKVLVMRFGLVNKKLTTISETALELGVSAERIKQIQTKALKRLGIGKFNFWNYRKNKGYN